MIRLRRNFGRLGIAGAVLLALILTLLVTFSHRTSGRVDLSQTIASPPSSGPTSPAPIVTPATRPTEMLTANATCITSECHTDLGSAQHVHGPVAAGNCFACHAPDAGGHKFPLKREGSETCTFCHTVAGVLKHQHKAMEKGCSTCHQPHVSKAKFLLKFDSESALCRTCHAIPDKQFQHDPFARGECSLCHAPHQSDNASLLKGADGTAQCARCHEALAQRSSRVEFAHAPSVRDCATCHSPHSSDFPHQLRRTIDETCTSCHLQIAERVSQAAFKHDAVTMGSKCANCHNPHGSNNREMLRDQQDRVCLECHDKSVKTADGRTIPDMRPTLTQSKFLHGPIRTGECSPCHESHAGDRKQLLRSEFPESFYTPFSIEKYALCFKCHDKELVLSKETEHLTGFRDGKSNLHYLHVNRDPKGRSCSSCHAMHGSNLPDHVAEKVQFDGSAWAMDIGYTATSEGGSCQPGCHAKRDYSRSGAGLTGTIAPQSGSLP